VLVAGRFGEGSSSCYRGPCVSLSRGSWLLAPCSACSRSWQRPPLHQVDGYGLRLTRCAAKRMPTFESYSATDNLTLCLKKCPTARPPGRQIGRRPKRRKKGKGGGTIARRGIPPPNENSDRRPISETFGRSRGSVRRPATAPHSGHSVTQGFPARLFLHRIGLVGLGSLCHLLRGAGLAFLSAEQACYLVPEAANGFRSIFATDLGLQLADLAL